MDYKAIKFKFVRQKVLSSIFGLQLILLYIKLNYIRCNSIIEDRNYRVTIYVY